jgi:hypothetical protein
MTHLMTSISEIKFAREKPLDVIEEMVPLIVAHHKEISLHPDLKLKPNLTRYQQLEDLGALRIYTARKDSKLLGYMIFLISESLHFENVTDAYQDILYIDPSHRGFGLSFFRWVDTQLKNDGVNFILQNVTTKCDFSPLLKRLRYELCDYLYVKRLT